MTAIASVLQRNRILNTITGVAQTNQGLASAAASTIRVFTGAAPGVENAVTGTLLATYILFSSTTGQSLLAGASGGVAMLTSTISVLAAATGTAGYARWNDSNGAGAIEGTVGILASGADIILDSLSLSSGVLSTLLAASVRQPSTIGTVQMNSVLVDDIVNQVTRNTGVIPGLGASGAVSVYTGSAPASVESPPTGTLLAIFATGAQGWATASGAVANLAASLSVAPTATGTAGYARWSKGAYVLQCSIGSSATDIIVDTTAFVSGVSRSITDMSLTF